jgi:hypothetical protein
VTQRFRNLAEPPAQEELQQELSLKALKLVGIETVKAVGFVGRRLFILGLDLLWVIWFASWDWSAASTTLANQTPLSLLELIGKSIAALLVSAGLLFWAFYRKPEKL